MLAWPLILAVRAVSEVTELVGSDVIVTAIPRDALANEPSGGLLIGPPGDANVTSLYVPAEMVAPDDPWVQYGPVHVGGGMIIGGLEISNRPLPPLT